jgi:hypothetical protein
MDTAQRASERTERPADDGAGAPLDISVVIPCLNEEASISECVRRGLATIRTAGLAGEVVVVDNGSHDRSPELATEAGARVVREERKGYGSAYLRGFREARGELIFMSDADGTYPFEDLPRFLDAMGGGAEFVLGDRFAGTMEPGAMAWDRRIGNHLLSGMLRIMFRPGVHDAHCGLRLISKQAVERMSLSSTGMEFASEMLIAAKAAGVQMAEIPIDYAARADHNPSKLNSIPDGIRHVTYMLSAAPAGWVVVPAAILLGGGLALVLAGGSILKVVGAVLVAIGVGAAIARLVRRPLAGVASRRVGATIARQPEGAQRNRTHH